MSLIFTPVGTVYSIFLIDDAISEHLFTTNLDENRRKSCLHVRVTSRNAASRELRTKARTALHRRSRGSSSAPTISNNMLVVYIHAYLFNVVSCHWGEKVTPRTVSIDD